MTTNSIASPSQSPDTYYELDLRSVTPLRLPTHGAAYRVGKRALDLLMALVILPPILLLAAIVAVLVKISSPGPIFFRHTRVGQGRKPFGLWKFRTMTHGSDDLLTAHLAQNPEAYEEWLCYRKLRKDPRVTRIGAILRKTNLDELPQILNVLRGEMSMVGPRPVVEEELERYGAGEALYSAARPGLTGLWQVSGRGCVSYERRVALDVEYVSTWSFTGDLVVLTKTVNAIRTGRGAF